MSYDEAWRRDFDRRAAEQRQQAQQVIEASQRAQEAPGPAHRAPQDSTEWARRAKPWLLIAAGCVVLGIIFVAVGAEANSPDLGNQTPGAPELWIGGILIVVPILAIAISILVSVARFSAEQARRYRAWKKTLTPEQLVAVRMAEWAATFVALETAHVYMKRSNERMHARSTAALALHERRRREAQERTARIQAMQDAAAGQGPAIWQQAPQPRMWQQP